MSEGKHVSMRILRSDGQNETLEPGIYYTFEEGPEEAVRWTGPFDDEEAAAEAALEQLLNIYLDAATAELSGEHA